MENGNAIFAQIKDEMVPTKNMKAVEMKFALMNYIIYKAA
jgi:hypothetical protein